MPSVDFVNLQAGAVTWREVLAITGPATFLRAPIERPAIQFASWVHLRRIVSQNIISEIRPHLALQASDQLNPHPPTSGNLLALNVHDLLAFSSHFKALILTTPMDLRGLHFLSIDCINSALAIAGLHRDPITI